MTDGEKSAAETSADPIEQEKQPPASSRGNVHSEEETSSPDQEVPPPHAH